jgi:TRAP-type C4-dicarboxylate transport system permease large subunit
LIFGVLLVALLVGIAPNVNTVVVQAGEVAWPGYAKDLRVDPEEPECSLEELDVKLESCPTDGEGNEEAGGTDPFGGGDPFAEPSDAPKPAPVPAPADAFGGGDPFAEDAGEPAAGDPFGGDPFAEEAEAKSDVNCAAVRSLRDRCEIRHTEYTDNAGRITSGVKVFRAFEGGISAVARFPYWRQLLVLLVGLGAFVTTWSREHIALRVPATLMEHRVRQASELVAALFLLASQWADLGVQQASTAEVENGVLPYLWGTLFLVLSAVNLMHLAMPPADLKKDEPSTPFRMLMVVPLYVWMTVIAGLYFLGIEGHASGQAIYLHAFLRIPNIYLGIGLYIWAGMLLRRTRIASLIFSVVEPLGLPPAILAWLVVVLAAFPTAYSGASGIFVIAAGAVIFQRLRAAGASKRLALAATAMSGSLGVVLRPCLVVVLIAILNKQVTTADLFGWGLYVFALTAILALVAFLWMNEDAVEMTPLGEASGPIGRALMRVMPYIVIGIGIVLAFGYGLGTWLNEHTAPFVVPVAMLALITYDKFRATSPEDPELDADDPAAEAWWPSLLSATGEASHHVGALLMLMACSVCLGGIVERSEVMYAVVPESFGSTWVAMAFLVVVMVLVGMTMDALGAVILVSFTVAKVAYDNGIDPVHFWMMVLVAFELGYLTPPVSLNHLLARQVIGPESFVENDPVEGGFYKQYEHILMPMGVMGTALVLVAFGPLFFY